MRKCAAVLSVLFITAFITGCGGSKGSTFSGITHPSVTKVALAATDVTDKHLFFITPINATSINRASGYISYQFNTDGTALLSGTPATTGQPLLDTNGSWNNATISTDGALVLTVGGQPTRHFTCIQKESSYWLFYDDSGKLNRFYFAAADAEAYQNSIKVAVPPNTVKLGGNVQGTALALPHQNVITYAGISGTAGFANHSTAGNTTPASFNHPVGITTDGTNLYVTDYDNNAIRKISISNPPAIRTLAGSPFGFAGLADVAVATGATTADGTAARFNHPTGITTDGTSLYVTDSINNAIRKIDIATSAVTTIAGSTSGDAGSIDDDTGTNARFNQPNGITTDGTNLYVTDSGNHTIRKIVLSGTNAVTTLAGAAGSSGSADGIGIAAHFFIPARIACDGTYLYVTDFNNRTIRRISIASGEVKTIAGAVGVTGLTVSAASGDAARFDQPNGIATDGTYLYVTDTFNNTVSRIRISNGTSFSGPVTLIAGSTVGAAGSADASGTAASFNNPVGITTDGTSLFVVDSFTHIIRKID